MKAIFVLEDEELARIHSTSLRILGETGIKVAHESAMRLLQERGARVDLERQRAWFPEELVDQALSTVPKTFNLAGSDPEHDVTLGNDGRMHARPVVGADFVVTPGASHHRAATLEDTENWIKLVSGLPNIHLNGCPYPTDVPPGGRDVVVVERVLELSAKPVLISHYSAAGLRWSLELMATLPDRGAGSRLLIYVSCNSPLTWTRSEVDLLLAAGQHRVPVGLNTAPLAGATAPYTMAGLAAQMNAELLAGVTLAQVAHPGAPLLWSPLPLVLDMRSTAASGGYAEMGLLMAAFVQLGKFYHLPTHCLGMVTDAVIPDAQASLEKVLVSYAALLARPNLVGGVGGLSAYNVASMEQLVLDSDLLGGVFHTLEGIHLSRDSLAWDVIDRVGPEGHFLEDRHTLKHLRREYYFSQMANRLSADTWVSAGGLDLRARAAERVCKLLAEPVEPAVPEDVAREMRRLVQHAQKELAQ
jgi:trimethylamine--corrinoid protein Co-methyltransferase